MKAFVSFSIRRWERAKDPPNPKEQKDPMINWTEIKFFKPSEFDEPDKLSPVLVYKLDRCRKMAKVPMIITSSYRPLKGPRDSAHRPNAKGFYEAVDIRCNEPRARFKIKKAAYQSGFCRIGTYNLHVHLDVAREGFDQDVEWLGKSK